MSDVPFPIDPIDPRDLEPAPNPYEPVPTPGPFEPVPVPDPIPSPPNPSPQPDGPIPSRRASYNYFIEKTETRTWYGKQRFNWRVIADNGQIILSSNQGHSNRVDRDEVISHFLDSIKLGFVDPTPRSEDLYENR